MLNPLGNITVIEYMSVIELKYLQIVKKFFEKIYSSYSPSKEIPSNERILSVTEYYNH